MLALLLTLFFGRWVLPYRSSGKDGGGPSPLLARGAMGCGDASERGSGSMTRLGVENLDPALLKHKVQSGRVGSASAFTIKFSFTLLL